ncbi:MAG: hypothetical protein ACW991_05105 [Candidatus Hodarchaeales archaeon]|jgi:hypothetical protein
MTQDITDTKISKDNSDVAKAELADMLSRFGWKWAAMTSTVGKLHRKGEIIPSDMLNKIRMSRTQIESGCYSVCEIASSLREIENPLFCMLMKSGPQETDKFLDLTCKAINGQLTRGDINLQGAEPILSDCLTLPCVCKE